MKETPKCDFLYKTFSRREIHVQSVFFSQTRIFDKYAAFAECHQLFILGNIMKPISTGGVNARGCRDPE